MSVNAHTIALPVEEAAGDLLLGIPETCKRDFFLGGSSPEREELRPVIEEGGAFACEATLAGVRGNVGAPPWAGNVGARVDEDLEAAGARSTSAGACDDGAGDDGAGDDGAGDDGAGDDGPGDDDAKALLSRLSALERCVRAAICQSSAVISIRSSSAN